MRKVIVALFMGLITMFTLAPSAQANTLPEGTDKNCSEVWCKYKAGTDHWVECIVNAANPFVQRGMLTRAMYGPGRVTCAPTPPDTSLTYLQLQVFVPGNGFTNLGPPVTYDELTTDHYYMDANPCPNPNGLAKLYRTKMHGFLIEDGVADSANDYSPATGGVTFRC